MGIGDQTDFVIYHDEFYGGMVERIEQNVNAFNAASNNALRIVTESSIGNYQKESFIKDISALVTRRDVITSPVGAAADTEMVQGEEQRVKLNRKIGPVANTLDSWRKIGRDSREMSLKLGQMVADKKLQDYIKSAVLSLHSATGTDTGAMVVDVSAATAAPGPTLDYTTLANALAKFGDMSGNVVAWIMHSKVFFDLYKTQLSAGSELVNVGEVAVRTGGIPSLNRPVIVTDAAGMLTTGGTPDPIYSAFGVVEGGVVIIESEQQELVSDVVTGLENLVFRIQGEFAYNIGIKGYTWGPTSATPNPTDAQLLAANNWDQVATNDKHTAAVRIDTA